MPSEQHIVTWQLISPADGMLPIMITIPIHHPVQLITAPGFMEHIHQELHQQFRTMVMVLLPSASIQRYCLSSVHQIMEQAQLLPMHSMVSIMQWEIMQILSACPGEVPEWVLRINLF